MAEPGWVTAARADPALGWVAIHWDRAARQPGAWFDADHAAYACDLFEQTFRLTEDRFAGHVFRLNRWQRPIVMLIFGWKIPADVIDPATGEPTTLWVRLFRTLRLWIPRKNGKSEFLAALNLFAWVFDAVAGGQGFCFARDEKQAKIVFDKMKVMIAASPVLSKAVTVFKKSLYIADPRYRSSFELLPGKAEGRHGLSPTVISGDEMHEWRSEELADTLRQGTGARTQPLELYASTAGLKSAQVGYKLFVESQAILDGTIDDPSTLVVIFAAPPEADWQDEAVWHAANPSLGLSPTIDFLRREAAKAAGNPRAESHFRRYHLNQWVENLVRWLPVDKWAACSTNDDWAGVWEQMKGRRCYLAFDLSRTRDVTALIALFPPEEPGEKSVVACRFFVPQDNIETRTRNDKVAYATWVKSGAITATPGDFVDQDFVREAVKQCLTDYEVQAIGYDAWSATKLVGDLQKDGVDPDLFVVIRQGHGSLGGPTAEFEKLVFAGDIDHRNHPVLAWMAGNTVLRFDQNMNFVPDKKHSAEKIDGIAATVMAVALTMGGEESGSYLESAEMVTA